MLTIFGNLWVNRSEKLQHLKDSLESFENISDDWIINVRGKFRDSAIEYLKERLGEKMTLFELLDENRGWTTNALEMIKKAKYEYVFLWNEDHINMAPQEIYKGILREMKNNDADSMWYSWWLNGKSRAIYDKLEMKKGRYIDMVKLSHRNWEKVYKEGHQFYLVTFMSIFKKSFFVKLLKEDENMYPFSYTQKLLSAIDLLNRKKIRVVKEELFPVINRLFRFRFRKFSEVTPFNIEKEQYRTDILPLKIALPKRELFVCIEDDLLEPGYSLISRGLYRSNEKVRNTGR